MKRYGNTACDGFTLIEMLMVFVIIGALTSIAIPYYAANKDKAKEAQCEASRYHIELDEKAYFIEHGKAGLIIDERYECSSGGTYVWLVSDPDDPDYPRIGCSVHYNGETVPDLSPQEPIGPTGPDTPPGEDPNKEKVVEETRALIEYIITLGLNKGQENILVSRLSKASKSLEEERNELAIWDLNAFIDYATVQKGKKIPASEADMLISKVATIIKTL